MGQSFCAAGKILKKGPKNFLFSARAPTSKLVYIGAKVAFGKISGPINKNGYLKTEQ